MQILQLCKKFPYPLKDGESIAVTYLSRALHELGCKLTLLAMNTSKHHVDTEELASELDHYEAIHVTELDNEIRWQEALFNLLSRQSYHITRFINRDFEARLREILQAQAFDVVLLESLYMAPYIPVIRKFSQAKVVMRAHNVEYEIWERIADHTPNVFKRLYLKYLTRKLRRYEVQQLGNYDLLMAISHRDYNTFRKLGYSYDGIVVPIGLDASDYFADEQAFEQPESISFIGSLDWMPNQEGLEWFLQKVWPVVNRMYPHLSLHVAGRNTPSRYMEYRIPGVEIHGEVESSVRFINGHAIMVVPLFSGSGMRAKILEGMALGRAVITTSLGLEGIDATHMKEVLVADTVDEFIESIQYCLQHPDDILELGRRAQVFVAKHYDNLEIARKVLATWKLQPYGQSRKNKV